MTYTRTTVASTILSVLLVAASLSSGSTFSFPAVHGNILSKATTTATFGSIVATGGPPSAVLSKKPSTTTQLQASSSGSSGDGTVVIDSDFRVAAVFLALGLLLDTIPWIQLTLGPLITLLGVLFLVQTFRLKFVCDDTAFALDGSGENVVVGGENRWAYDSFVNYDFFPQGWEVPILVYFKENQTPSDKWDQGPGQSANSEEALAKGALPGQVHFFPALCNCQQLKAEWERRGCQKLP